MRLLLLSLPLLVLAGCQSTAPEYRVAADRQTCRDYGFTRNNDAFNQCMLRLEVERRQTSQAYQAPSDDWDIRRPRYYF